MRYDMIETQSREATALRILKMRKPVLLIATILVIYGKLGVPAIRWNYQYFGGSIENMTSAEVFTLKGEKLYFDGYVPQFLFVKDGRVTFPRNR